MKNVFFEKEYLKKRIFVDNPDLKNDGLNKEHLEKANLFDQMITHHMRSVVVRL